MIVLQSLASVLAEPLFGCLKPFGGRSLPQRERDRVRENRYNENPLSVYKEGRLSSDSWILAPRVGSKFCPPHPKSTLLHPNATVALGCETLHWVATALSRSHSTGSIASDILESKAFQARQTEDKPRQTKKLSSGRVALGCRILCFLCCLLFKASQKRSKLQNEPNFQIKPIKPKLNRFFKMQPYATLHLSYLTTSSSSMRSLKAIQAYSRSFKAFEPFGETARRICSASRNIGRAATERAGANESIQALKKIVIFSSRPFWPSSILYLPSSRPTFVTPFVAYCRVLSSNLGYCRPLPPGGSPAITYHLSTTNGPPPQKKPVAVHEKM